MTTNPLLGDKTDAIRQATHEEMMAKQNETYMCLYVDSVRLSTTLETLESIASGNNPSTNAIKKKIDDAVPLEAKDYPAMICTSMISDTKKREKRCTQGAQYCIRVPQYQRGIAIGRYWVQYAEGRIIQGRRMGVDSSPECDSFPLAITTCWLCLRGFTAQILESFCLLPSPTQCLSYNQDYKASG